MKQDLQNQVKFTQNLKNIHGGHGSYHMPSSPGSKLPVFRGQTIFIDDYKQILKERQIINKQMKSYVSQNKKNAFKFSPKHSKSDKNSDLSRS